MQADEHQRHRSEDQHYGLHHFGVDDRAQSTENRIESGDDDESRSAGPEIKAGDGAHHDATREERHADFRENVADDGHPGEVGARLRVVSALEEFRHRVHGAAQVERHEQPAEQEQDEARQPLEVAHRQTARRAGARKTDQMLATNVRSEQACAYREPTHISARQKEVGADVLLALGGPPGDRRQYEEVGGDDDDVDETEVAHGVRSVDESGRPSLWPSWTLKSEPRKIWSFWPSSATWVVSPTYGYLLGAVGGAAGGPGRKQNRLGAPPVAPHRSAHGSQQVVFSKKPVARCCPPRRSQPLLPFQFPSLTPSEHPLKFAPPLSTRDT